MANTSKTKGNTFERKIAKLFSDKFKHLFDGKECFRRNVTSGGYFGGSNSVRTDTIIDEHKIDIGDIMTPPGFRFTLECKFYKTPFTLNSLMNGNNAQLDKWIEQAELQSKLACKDFLLIIKFNDVKEIVVSKELLVSSNYISYNGYYISNFEKLMEIEDFNKWFITI